MTTTEFSCDGSCDDRVFCKDKFCEGSTCGGDRVSFIVFTDEVVVGDEMELFEEVYKVCVFSKDIV